MQEQEDGLHLDDQDTRKAFVQVLRGILARNCGDETQVLVEFVLPRDMLSRPVDQWLDPFDDPLGSYLKVVVRSRERLRNTSERLGWQNGWKNVMARGQERIPDGLWWYNPDEAKQMRPQLQRGVCVAPKFVPDAHGVSTLLHRGAAVALWPRRSEGLGDLVSQFEVLSAHGPLQALPDVMRDIRQRLWANDQDPMPCDHLTLLWDDPTHHVPEDEDNFLHAPA